jgi:hypothetical protein
LGISIIGIAAMHLLWTTTLSPAHVGQGSASPGQITDTPAAFRFLFATMPSWLSLEPPAAVAKPGGSTELRSPAGTRRS